MRANAAIVLSGSGGADGGRLDALAPFDEFFDHGSNRRGTLARWILGGPRDVQVLACAGQGDVEQSPVFPIPLRFPPGLHCFQIRPATEHASRIVFPLWSFRAFPNQLWRNRIPGEFLFVDLIAAICRCDEDDRPLQPFGAVHSHHLDRRRFARLSFRGRFLIGICA